MTKRFPLTSFLLSLLCLAPLLPASAQTPAPAPPVPRYVFVPDAPVTVPAGVLTFHPTPPSGPGAAQLQAQNAALSAQITALSAQNAGLTARALALTPTRWGGDFGNLHTDASPDGPHLAWLHEVMSQGEWGKTTNMDPYDGSTSPSVAQWTQQIHEAKSYGVDGDAMDIQGTDHTFTSAVENLLTAADQDNIPNMGRSNGKGVNDFHPFDQFDFSTYPQDPATIAAQFTKDIKHPSYARHNGLPILSTYAGEGGTYAQVQALFGFAPGGVQALLLAQAPPVRCWFQPFFNIRDPNGNSPSEPQAFATAREAAFLKPFASGAWLFGTGFAPPAGPQSGLSAAEVYSAALRAQGLTFWGTVSPGASGLAHSAPNRYFNDPSGFEGLNHQETSIIESQQCQDVEIVTGNDRNEGTATTNAPSGPGSPWNFFGNTTTPDFYPSTLGTQSELLYYSQWYKTGVRPFVTNNNLWMNYCRQPHGLTIADPLGAVGPTSTEDGAALPPDTIYVDTDDAKTETLTVTDGPATWTRTASPGFHHWRFGPYVPGAVLAVIKDPNTGQVLVSLPGEAIQTPAEAQAIGVYEWLPWTGVAHD